MLTKVRLLIEELNTSDIKYCHWKSNSSLAKALSGQTDIDLLIHQKDAKRFRTILDQQCFKPAITTEGETFPFVEHYYALDEETGALVHVHAYFRVITGESLAKNYRLPIEEMLLLHTREIDAVRLPTKSAELVVFTVRMMLKHTSLMELVLLARYWKQVRQEAEWLLEDDSIDDTLSLVNGWLPPLDTALFSDCIAALKAPAPLLRRVRLGRQLRSQLRPYARHSPSRAWLNGARKFAGMLLRRLTQAPKGMVLQRGGAIIAFVGSEATGKSTLLAEMSGWLGEHFAVKQVHVGKPPSSFLSAIPNLLVPALRSILPAHRSTHVEAQYEIDKKTSEKPRAGYPLLFAIRSVLLAYDRRALLSRAGDQAASGTIVLCDRYPSSRGGAPDSPQLSHLPASSNRYAVRRLLARVEARLYGEMPAPDLVIYLSAPLDVTVSRNANRGKKEPEAYVRRRHARSSNLEFAQTTVYKISTDQPVDQTVLEVKKAIWTAL